MAIIQNLEAFVQSYPAGLDSVTDLQLSQNENGRQIRFTIGGVTIPAGSVATISGTKPDGVVYSNTGTIEGSDTVIFDEDVQMTAVFGTWYAKIRIINGGNTIASARVRFIIDKDPVDAGAIPSESQLDGLVAEAEEYAEAAGDAAERAAITYGSPLTASTAAAMTDVNRVYVYTGSESGYTYGNWYYYNGSAWVSGGVYNSAAVETDTTLTESGVPADAKATGDKIAELKDDLSNIQGISDDVKVALLDCFTHVAWIDEHGQDYYDALYEALYEEPTPTDILYKLANPFYSNGNNNINTGFAFEQNTGKYTICMKFIIPIDTPDNESRSIFSSKYLNAGGNYYCVTIQKRTYSNSIFRMMFGWGVPWVESGTEGKYILGSLYNVVLVVDTDAIESTTYIYDTHTETKYTYDKSLNSAYLFNNQPIVIGKEIYETVINGFVGMVCDFVIKKGDLSETEINNYLYADVEKEDIIFEIGDISVSTGENSASSKRIRTQGYIEVSDSIVTTVGCPFAKTWFDYNHNPYSPYQIYSVHIFRCYDATKTFLGSVLMIDDSQTEKTYASLPSGTKYIRVVMQKGDTTQDQYTEGFSADATFPYYINEKSYRLREV